VSQSATVGYGLAGAIIWGAADFSGGVASRRAHVFSVALLSQLVGLLALLAAALVAQEALPARSNVLFGFAGGLAGILGLLMFYRGLAIGPMSLVAPLSAVVATAIPIPFAAAAEGSASLLQLLGILGGLVGIWLVAAGKAQAQPVTRPAVLLAAGAGVMFGLFFILFHEASPDAAFWPLVAGRLAGLATITALVAVQGVGLPSGRATFAIASLCGLLDAGGNVAFVLAASHGRLDVASFLVSLYPATTVLLGLFLLKERLDGRQVVGIAAMMGGIVLIAV
jgi:uncharacterized membrane protein